MSKITTRTDFDVDLVQSVGSDLMICQAARVSTQGAQAYDSETSKGLIGFLLKNRHGSPFEHNLMTFCITAPIFVWREFMRHRIGFSYNEESGRYKKLEPMFYVPAETRPLIQVGKAGAYTFELGTSEQTRLVSRDLIESYEWAWTFYEDQLAGGIAKEVARMCLPVGIYSTAYVSCNARSMMSFLSLRTKDDGSKFPSYPQYEINQVANLMEDYFRQLFPLTHAAFQEYGRVSP